MPSRNLSEVFARRIPSMSKISQISILYVCIILVSLSFSFSAVGVPVSKEESSTFQIENETLPQQWRSLNGSGNNIANPSWGSVGSEMSRLTDANFSDNISSLAHSEFKNPREISNIVCDEIEIINDSNGLSSINSLWSEFIRNDVLFAPHQDSLHPGGMEEAHISIPADDEIINPSGSHSAQMRYIRTEFIDGSGTDENNTRKYSNQASSWIDGSSIYGLNNAENSWVRSGSGGRVSVTDWLGSDMIPAYDSNVFVSNWDGSESHYNQIQFSLADDRNGENIGVSTLHLLFLREHNRLADAIEERNPDWSDEQIFQRARKLVIAQIQVITYSEYLPSLGINLPEYKGYNSSMNPEISNEFFLLVSNSFTSQRNDAWLLLNDSRIEISSSPLQLERGYWTMDPILDDGIEPLIRGAAFEPQRENDVALVSNLRNLLSGKSSWPGWIDECAMAIQLGRDRGITDYNSIRSQLGYGKFLNWSDLTEDENTSQQLSQAYDSIDRMDAIIGVLSEPRMANSVFGETQYNLAINQYSMLRDSDNYWYANDPELVPLLSELNNTSLSDIILRNSEVESIQCNVFIAESNVENFDCHLSNNQISIIDGDNTNQGIYIGVLLILIIMGIIVISKSGQVIESSNKSEELNYGDDE